jgi:hypothetical protein
MYGKQPIGIAAQQAAAKGVTLFAIGDKVRTNHGHVGTIIDVTAYGTGERLYWNMCCYHLAGDAFGSSGMLVDFIDAHYTSGGCLSRVQ